MEWEQLFQYWSSSVSLCHGDVRADAPVRGTILTFTTQTLTICNDEYYIVDDLLYSPARNRFNFIKQSIYL